MDYSKKQSIYSVRRKEFYTSLYTKYSGKEVKNVKNKSIDHLSSLAVTAENDSDEKITKKVSIGTNIYKFKKKTPLEIKLSLLRKINRRSKEKFSVEDFADNLILDDVFMYFKGDRNLALKEIVINKNPEYIYPKQLNDMMDTLDWVRVNYSISRKSINLVSKTIDDIYKDINKTLKNDNKHSLLIEIAYLNANDKKYILLPDNRIFRSEVMITKSSTAVVNRQDRLYAAIGAVVKASGAINYNDTLLFSIAAVEQKNFREPLPVLFNGIKYNCVIEQFRRNIRSEAKLNLLDKLNDKYYDSGVNDKALEEICRAVKRNVEVRDRLGFTWYEFNKFTEDGEPLNPIVMYTIGPHAVAENPISVKAHTTAEIHYVSLDDIYQIYLTSDETCRLTCEDLDKITGLVFRDRIYKRVDLFQKCSIENMKKVREESIQKKSRDPYQNVYSEGSYYYTRFLIENEIYDIKYDDELLYDYVKASNHYYSAGIIFNVSENIVYRKEEEERRGYSSDSSDEDDVTYDDDDVYEASELRRKKYFPMNVYAYDQNQAYASFKENYLFDKFKFPNFPTHFYYIKSELDSHSKLEILSKTGFSQIDKIDLRAAYLNKIRYLRPLNVYPNPLLYFLYTNGYADFDIISTAWDVEPAELEIELQEVSDNDDPEEKGRKKFINNSFFGRMVPNKPASKIILAKDEIEFRRLCGSLSEQGIPYIHNEKFGTVCYQEVLEENYKKLYHVHAYILAYQQISFLDKLLKVPFGSIVKVKVDCFYTLPHALYVPDTVGSKKRGLWKSEKVKVADIYYDWEVYSDKYCGDDEDRPFTTVKIYKNIPQFDLWHLTLKRYNLIIGQAGSGKTYKLCKNPSVYNPALTFYTNTLTADKAKEWPDKFIKTCATYYDIGTRKKRNLYHPNVVVDECTMLGVDDFNIIMTRHLSMRGKLSNIYFVGDFIQKNIDGEMLWKTAQLSPPLQADITHSYYFEMLEVQTMTHNYRCKDPLLNTFLQMVRNHTGPTNELTEEEHSAIDFLETRLITPEMALKLYDKYNKDIIISGTNRIVDEYNDILYKEALKELDVPILKLKSKITSDRYAKNERIICGVKSLYSRLPKNIDLRKIPKNFKPAWATTVHVIQGKTIKKNEGCVFFDMRNSDFDDNLFYVAISRVEYFDQLYIIIDPLS